jgi:putative membrane protein
MFMSTLARISSTVDALRTICASGLAAACLFLPAKAVYAGDAVKTSAKDKHFIQQASENCVFELQFGRLTQQQTRNNEIKQLAQKIVQDYTQASQKLDTLAQSLGITLDSKLNDQAAASLDKIAAMSGQDFDRAALGEMIKVQESTVRLLEDQSKEAKNKALQQLAADLLSDVQDDVFQTVLLYSEFKRVAQNPLPGIVPKL